MKEKYTAARYFFYNCCVSVLSDGSIRTTDDKPASTADKAFQHTFTPAASPSEFINIEAEFYRFLSFTSLDTAAIFSKLLAIGHALCNISRPNGTVDTFICADDSDFPSPRNGKRIFVQALAHFLNTAYLVSDNCDAPSWLYGIKPDTQLFCLYAKQSSLNKALSIMPSRGITITQTGTGAFAIVEVTSPLTIALINAPADQIATKLDSDALILRFSDFFSPHFTTDDLFGQKFFSHNWPVKQWDMFYNLMFYCVSEYLKCLNTLKSDTMPDTKQ